MPEKLISDDITPAGLGICALPQVNLHFNLKSSRMTLPTFCNPPTTSVPNLSIISGLICIAISKATEWHELCFIFGQEESREAQVSLCSLERLLVPSRPIIKEFLDDESILMEYGNHPGINLNP